MVFNSCLKFLSVLKSSAENESSNIYMLGFLYIARAIASLCFCPPDTFVPPCDISSSYCFCFVFINSSDCDIRAASSNCFLFIFSCPNAIFDFIVPVNSTPFCGTIPIFSLRSYRFSFLMSIPSINIWPPVTSKNLGIRFISVDLPEPVPPIIAVVVPGVALNDIFSNISSSASWYLKYTSLNYTLPLNFFPISSIISGSFIDGSLSNISAILFIDIHALGIIIDIIDIIRNDIIICIVY